MLLTMLPTHREVNQIVDIFVENAKKDSIFVDSSTVAPLESKKINEKLNSKGF